MPEEDDVELRRHRIRLLAIGLVTLALSVPLAAPAAAARGELVWGGDQEGGGPYVYPRDDDPEQVTGFEVELADALAARLGLTARFFQGPWDKMPELLRTGKIDVVLNGYEWTPVRAEVMAATIPYYVYGLQLLARKDGRVHRLEDLEPPPAGGTPLRVGVLTGSAAEDYARKLPGLVVVTYDGNTDAMREVETGKLDATFQDTPIAAFYAPRFPALQRIGEPVGRGYYVIYARSGDTARVQALDAALAGLIGDGTLERIYRRYGIWDDAQGELRSIAAAGRFFGVNAIAAPAPTSEALTGATEPGSATVTTGARKRGMAVVRAYGPVLIASAGMTVILSVLSFPLAIALGLLVAVGRLYGPAWLKPLLAAYVEFLRGTPLMLQLFFIFFFLPEVGINVPAFSTAVLGLAVNYSAYESEIYRAGLQAIPPGQMEAALSLGMSRRLALVRILIPQAVRIVIPPVMNDFIALFKDTSVVSVITLVELTKRFSVLSQSTQATPELMAMTAVLYLLMSYPLSLASRHVERRLDREARA